MKKLLSLIVALTGITGYAVPLLYDGFDYPTSSPAPQYTNLCGQVNPGGNAWLWAAPLNNTSTNNQPWIAPGNLPTPPGLYPAAGNSVHFGGKGANARIFINSVYSNTVYYSFLLKVTDLTSTTTSGGFFTAITGGAATGTAEPNLLVAAVQLKKVDTTKYVLGIKKAGAGNLFPVPEITNNVGDVIFVVASYEFVTYPGGTGDKARLWINPDPSTFGAASPPAETLLSTGSNDIGTPGYPLNSVTLFNRTALFEAAHQILDELTVGTTWADVTPTTSVMAFTTQPRSQRVLPGGSATFNCAGYRSTTYQWKKNGADIPGATGKSFLIAGAQQSDAATYTVVIGNGVTSLTSTPAVLTVDTDRYARLSPLWSIAAGSRPYLTVDPGQTPYVRHFAFNSLSNQLLVVSRTNTSTLASTGMVYVINADSGADLYQMNADSGIISGGAANAAGTLMLSSINVADDGAVYAANISDANNAYRVYRWDNSGPAAAPTLVWEGDPSGLGTLIWGDSMGIRGQGASTQLLLDDRTGNNGAILTNLQSIATCLPGPFMNLVGGQAGGRTLKFDTGDTFWEKHGGASLYLVSYDATPGVWMSSIVTNYGNFPGGLGVCDFNPSMKLLAGLSQGTTGVSPNKVQLFEISDPSQPVLLDSYNFPINRNDNANRTGRVIWAGDRVFALDSNNGLMAFSVVPVLHILPAAPNVVVSWSSAVSGFMLKATPSLNPPVTWTNVGAGTLTGDQYFQTNSAGAANLFYRLEK